MDENNFDGQQDGQQGGEITGNTSEFSIPQEYQEKEWVKNFEGQTGDDLKANVFKALDEKYSSMPVVPEDTEGYAFNDILKDENGELMYEYPDDALSYFGDKFKDLGLTKEQGQGILKEYTDFEIKEFRKYTNSEELETNINQMFNGNQKQRQTVESLIKEFLPQEDQAFLQKTAPNYTIEMFYKLANGLVNKYGFKEGSAGSYKGSNFIKTQADKDAEYENIVKKLEELEKRPHTSQEKDALMAQLVNVYN